MDAATVRVTGLRGLERALAESPSRMHDELELGLAEAGQIVAAKAHGFIRAKGLEGGPRSSGRLDRLTKATRPTKTGRVFVRSSARRLQGKNAPYAYPKVWEFARGGERAFLHPALEASSSEVVSRLDRALAAVADNFHNA